MSAREIPSAPECVPAEPHRCADDCFERGEMMEPVCPDCAAGFADVGIEPWLVKDLDGGATDTDCSLCGTVFRARRIHYVGERHLRP